MKITIVGAGNIGTQFAVHCAYKGHQVIMFGSKPHLVQNRLAIVNHDGIELFSGEIYKSTSEPKEAFEDTELIFVTVPAFCMESIAKEILPFIKADVKICLVPGNGGGEWAFKACIERGAIVFGMQRVPSVARLVEYGKSVCATGYRDCLYVAAIPCDYGTECADIIENIFDIRCETFADYLNLTLIPSNPILHTTRLYNLFRDYDLNTVYESIPLFYEDWTDETSELIFLCDDEVQKICKRLSSFDLSGVISLKQHYESYTVQELTKKIQSIEGFKGLETPSVKVENGYKPDLHSRYFTADFSFGLEVLVQTADFAQVNHTNMSQILEWYNSISIVKERFDFQKYGIQDISELIQFYKR